MKHVSWILALAVGFAIGWAANGATSTRPATRAPGLAAAQAPGQARAPARPTEDPRAVYRVTLDDSPLKGPADALVTVVESSDFECPFCKRVVPTLKSLEEQYRGKIRFVFKHNPLPFHPRAAPSANAAEEARAEGGDAKFWAMHDALFAAPSLDEASILKAAADVGVDPAKVKAAMDQGKYRDRIERDQRLAQGLGATGTPAFFINGRKLVGAQPLQAFQALVDEELGKAEALVKQGVPASQVYARTVDKGATATVFQPVGAEAGPAAPPAQPPPAPPTVYREVPIRADDPARGAAQAKLTVVLFSDFQCPFCARVEPTLAELEKAFPGKVRVIWKHQPLPMHPNALPAAFASEAAREQGKFWPMHDKLFASQQALSPETYRAAAKEIGLDLRRFDQAVAARRGEARIQEDQKLAAQVGANGTPTMFFNCRQVVGAQPLAALRQVAEEELRKADEVLGPTGAGPAYDRLCKSNVTRAPTAAIPAAAGVPAVAGAPAAIDVRPDDPMRGNPKAPVTIVLFSDFQCPFCARVEPTLAAAERAYGDKVRVVWKHQPLSFHPNALPAAKAAEAAREQGKFWPMHDRLFAAQQELSPDLYDRLAKELGLDVRRFQDSIRGAKGLARIEEDQRLAARVGVSGTPTLFVNGEKVEGGAVGFPVLKAVIDRKLGL